MSYHIKQQVVQDIFCKVSFFSKTAKVEYFVFFFRVGEAVSILKIYHLVLCRGSVANCFKLLHNAGAPEGVQDWSDHLKRTSV